MRLRYSITIALLTVMTNFAHSAVRCGQVLQDPFAWADIRAHFKTTGQLQLRGHRNGQALYIEANGNRRRATESEKTEAEKEGLSLPEYRPFSGTLEQTQASIPWFLETIDRVNSFTPAGGVPPALDIVVRLDSNKNGQLPWFRWDKVENGHFADGGSRILMSLKVVNAPTKFGKMPTGIDVPPNIIKTVFAHEYGHAIFNQLMAQRGLDYVRKLEKIKKQIGDRFLEGLQKTDQELGSKSSDLKLVAESVFAFVADPSNPDSLTRQKQKIRNLISPYSELFADTVDALASGSMAAHTEAIEFYKASTLLVNALHGKVDPEWYDKNYLGTVRSFLETGREKEYTTKNLESWHEALDPVRGFLGKSGIISDSMSAGQKKAFLNHFINIIVDEIRFHAVLVTPDSFPAQQMSDSLIKRLKKDFGK